LEQPYFCLLLLLIPNFAYLFYTRDIILTQAFTSSKSSHITISFIYEQTLIALGFQKVPNLPADLFRLHITKYKMKITIQSILLLTTTATATATIESVTIHGQVHTGLINDIYSSRGGTWNLSNTGVKGFENASITGLILNADLDAMFPNRSTTSNGGNSSLSSRGVVTYGTPSCDEVNNSKTYALFTVEQQQFIAGDLCKAMGYITPHVWGVVGYVLTGITCDKMVNGKRIQKTCGMIATVLTTQAGVLIQPAWYDACTNSYNSITDSCGQSGGVAQVTLPDTTVTPVVEVTYQTEIWATEMTLLSDYFCRLGKVTCTKYQCVNDECGGPGP
jgi:hypothetical protein